MLPEEQELLRLESEQVELETQVAIGELALETDKAETERFQHHYYETVGRLYAELDELDTQIANTRLGQSSEDVIAQANARSATHFRHPGILALNPPGSRAMPQRLESFRQGHGFGAIVGAIGRWRLEH